MLLWSAGTARSAELRIEIQGLQAVFSTQELLDHPDTRQITVALDPVYQRKMRYQGLPLNRLLEAFSLPVEGEMEMIASDGFVSLVPLHLLAPGVEEGAGEGAEAWLAIEPPEAPWPSLAEGKGRTGPFYLVWLKPEESDIRSEQWPYALTAIRLVEPAVKRWPQLAVDPALPADDAARAGQKLFIVQCMPCHRLNEAGTASMGPDLNKPVSATSYLTEQGLRQLVRDPASLRSWPEMRMPGFDEEALSDAEIDQIIAYLKHMANR